MEKGLLICSIDTEHYAHIIDGFVIPLKNYNKENSIENILNDNKDKILQKLKIKIEDLIIIKWYDDTDEDFQTIFGNDDPGEFLIKYYSGIHEDDNIEDISFNIAIIDII